MGLLEWIRRLFGRAPAATEAQRPPDALEWLIGVAPFQPGTGPSRLIIMRHAEKTGDKRDPRLSPPGQLRAEQLVAYVPEIFGRPDFLIAARTSKRSRRPVETLQPLAAALTLEIWAKIDDDDPEDLIAALRGKQHYRGKFGVISWRHSELPGLVRLLGAAPNAFPKSWDENDYTTIIEISFPGNGETRTRRLRMPF